MFGVIEYEWIGLEIDVVIEVNVKLLYVMILEYDEMFVRVASTF